MKITLNLEKRFAYVIIGVLIVVLGALIVYSYGGSQPAVVGHSWGEIVCDNNMCVDVNNGRVGIGTTNPYAKLDVIGTMKVVPNTYNSFLISNAVDQAGFYDNLGLDLVSAKENYLEARILLNGFTNANGSQIDFYTRQFNGPKIDTTKPAMTILGNGNVGIGTTNPQAKLDVNGKIRGEFDCRVVTAEGVTGAIAQCAPDEFLLTGGGVCETDNPGCGLCGCVKLGFLHNSYPNGNSWVADCYGYDDASDVCVRAIAVCCKK